jgi:hypothetical protein
MKTVFAFIGLAVLVAVSVRADPIIVKQRAMELRNQNNVRQGVPPASQPAPRAATQTTASSASATAVQQSMAKLRASLTAIKAGSPVTAAQKQQIAKDVIGLAHGASKPSESTAASLADNLATALAAKPLSQKDCNRLLSDLAAVLNPANIPASRMQAVHSDIQAIFQANGMGRNDAIKIVDQVKAVGAQAR